MNRDAEFALFADALVEQETKQLVKTGTKIFNDPQKGIIKVTGPDLSKIKTDDKFINSILEHSFGVIPEVKKEKIEPIKETKKTPEDYTKELMNLIKQAQNLINEMTSCGNIGTATVEPKQPIKKKKNKLIDKIKMKYRLK